MKFIDLNRQYQRSKPAIDQAIQKVLNHGQFIMGPEVKELETKLAEFVGAKHCIANSSGTTALQTALMALDVQPGDEIITPPFSFFATFEVIVMLGAKPVYVDIDSRTYNINANLIEQAITSKTKAIMPVSLYGQCADYDAINAIAAKHNLPVIEDAAQSFGATYKGRLSCNLTTIACTSFFPSKPLGCYGDGGACFTNDDELAHKMHLTINHGQEGRYNHVAMGMTGRCDTLQAAILLEKLKYFNEEIASRQQVAQWYQQAMQEHITIPYIEENNVSAYAQYTIAVENRDELQQELSAVGIPTAVHYPKGLHQQPISLQLVKQELHFPVTEQAAQSVISLPFHPYMQKTEVEQVADAILVNVAVAA